MTTIRGSSVEEIIEGLGMLFDPANPNVTVTRDGVNHVRRLTVPERGVWVDVELSGGPRKGYVLLRQGHVGANGASICLTLMDIFEIKPSWGGRGIDINFLPRERCYSHISISADGSIYFLTRMMREEV